MNKQRMILDADTGIDDAIALLYALLSPEIQVEGITTCFGNIDVEQATDNTLRLLKLAGLENDIPVAKGAAHPLVRTDVRFSEHVHGHNGIGGAELPASNQQVIRQSAAEYIVEMAHKYPGEITLVTLARMTNLALALELDPGIAGMFKQVVVMGGSVLVPGNVSPVAEANFAGDAEAAAAVFQSGMPLTIVGLDVTLQTLLTRHQLGYLLEHAPAAKQPMVAFLRDSLEHYFRFYQEANHLIGACPMHDLLAVLVAENPSLVTTQNLHAFIATEGEQVAGMVVTDRRAKPHVGRPVDFCLGVDGERAISRMMALFLSEYPVA
ncbi:nucleoside hydrolase [Paenibacillus yonginensis]|uniref:Nucleoside hydrolase n=1 Tax=Paenibacillus yonginensis TaxID=1462996 RepID=A0A1B1MX80_9BACL|nr:nucleoside hydrolase [Paenibacillus yonginensis]ANS73793.1 nucleoside hydrolase [Paenibacillus yonginensis]